MAGGGQDSLGGAALHIGHNAVENSLVTVYMATGSGQFPDFAVKPFHTLYVIGTLPIPRTMWAKKPVTLGVTLPFDSKVLDKTVKVNWGPGIVAHGYHEGGLLMLVFYGLLAGSIIRYLDELFRNNPNNPYMIGFLASASVQIIGWIRGDLSTMTPLAALCFLVMLGLLFSVKMLLGSQRAAAPMYGGVSPAWPGAMRR